MDGLVTETRQDNNTQHHCGPVKDAIEEKKIKTGGWSKQKKARNNQ